MLPQLRVDLGTRRLGIPEEVAEAIYYLGAVASKTTGEVHVVDGGRRLGRL